ncbi:arginine--tRNA ligase [Ostertagia ostertagi]
MNTSYLRRLRASGALKAILTDRASSRQCKKLVVDYSSPNIAKQFHIGNLRSTLIGRYIDKVHRAIGDDVTTVNYLGDWGTQFAMIATYWPHVRPSDSFWNSCNDVDKIRALTDCYVVANKKGKVDENFREKVRETYAEMENCIMSYVFLYVRIPWKYTKLSRYSGDLSSPTMQLWRDIRELSERHLNHFYSMLNIEFDRWQHESSYVKAARSLVADMVKDKIARPTGNGLWVVDLPGGELEDYAILRKSDSTTIYLSRELACILERDKLFEADQYLYVVDRAQRKHFEALKVILSRIGKEALAEKIVHVPYGRVKGLSTRSPNDDPSSGGMGRTEAVGDIINRGTELALQFMKESKTVKVPHEKEDQVARQLSISTVVFNDLKRAKSAEYEFSFKNAFDLNHNNALLLQSKALTTSFYVKHSRLCSIEENNAEILPLLDNCDSIPIETPEFAKLASQLEKFPDVIVDSAQNFEPCQLIVYLIELSHHIGSVITQAKVKGQPLDVAVPRLLLLSASRVALREGISLLGAPPVISM